ncbi:hypothetical protein HF984_09240 [Rothia terrae]|uniref:hypothetical protein n=1 Tax=Rothia terrae TaxID=396015 RepID=UPI001446286C|nr:hypothetical protein [Rothia terrae]NKZ34929.1 hypothetical protein [Rothia terrae]
MHKQQIEVERKVLQDKLDKLITEIPSIRIASPELLPFGWRKAAKGRTVWRIVEEIISQNLEKRYKELGFSNVKPAVSEVGVYDFEFTTSWGLKSFVNIKSSVVGAKNSKDDISKADKIRDFIKDLNDSTLFVATFFISFHDDLTVTIDKCVVFPVAWIPDIYVNPSNNGNLQSSKVKDLRNSIERNDSEFLDLLEDAISIANKKKLERNI